MQIFWVPTMSEIRRLRLATRAAVRSLQVVEEKDIHIHAWSFSDPELVLQTAKLIDLSAPSALTGLVFGAKDIFDTMDQPTEYGSSIYSGFQPRADASAVALLKASGALCLGKTVTSEFACGGPGSTLNPHRPTHTPGGSSMGSAAAVAAKMVDFALGTQTSGSVTRPASFCGIYGFKPTFGVVSTAGVKQIAPSLDTVGWFSRSALVLERVFSVLTRRSVSGALTTPPSFGVLGSCGIPGISGDSLDAVSSFVNLVELAQARVSSLELLGMFENLAECQSNVMAYEAWQAFAWERTHFASQMTQRMHELLQRGGEIDPSAYSHAIARRIKMLYDEEKLFQGVDLIVTPAALGEAPQDLSITGDPILSRQWTFLGLPTLAVPVSLGRTGMPVGVQLIGRFGCDSYLLAVANWLSSIMPT